MAIRNPATATSSKAQPVSDAAKYYFVQQSMTHPKFLHSNSTSHIWAFEAIAELVHNATDLDVMATKFWIEVEKDTNGQPRLCFTDNGYGMEIDKLYKMLSFGYCEKEEVDGHKPIGHYGNGFKSGSMRLGRDTLVFTRSKSTFSIGMLSQTFLIAENATSVLVPMVTWNAAGECLTELQAAEQRLGAIQTYSPFKTIHEIMNRFKLIPNSTKGGTGTHIVVYNLRKVSGEKDAPYELDFDTDKRDIRIANVLTPEGKKLHFQQHRTGQGTQVEIPIDFSLREYCSILYSKPRMIINLRGAKVRTKLVETSLGHTTFDTYKNTLTFNMPTIHGVREEQVSPEAKQLLLDQLIYSGNWEEVAKFLRTNCPTVLFQSPYSERQNLSTKTFVGKLAIHSLRSLAEDANNEKIKLQLETDQKRKHSVTLAKQRDELRKQLKDVETELDRVDAQVQQNSKLLTEKHAVLSCLQGNIVIFESTLKENEPALKNWQQKLQTDIGTWSCEDVAFLLTEIGLGRYSNTFLSNKIDGTVLKTLETSDLTLVLGVSFKEAKKLLMYLHLVQTHHDIYTIPAGVLQWNNDTVCTWLEDNKFSHLVDIFRKNQVFGSEFVFLEKTDLTSHLKIQALGDIIKLQTEISKLKDSLKCEHGLQAQLKNANNQAPNLNLEHQLEEMKRFNEELKIALKEKNTKIPDAFVCPITQDIMTDPVVASDGHTYERTAIELWLKNNNTSPMTGLQLANKQLTPSHTLKSMICEFVEVAKKK